MPRGKPGSSQQDLNQRHLTHQARRFVDLMIGKSMNQTHAYLQAFGCTYDTARNMAVKLVRAPAVKAEIERRLEKVEVTVDRVLRELAAVAFSDVRDYLTHLDRSGVRFVIDLSKIDSQQAAAVASVTVDATGGTGDGKRQKVYRTTLKMHDKLEALEMLGRYLGMWQDRDQGTKDLADAIMANLNAGRQRVAAVQVKTDDQGKLASVSVVTN